MRGRKPKPSYLRAIEGRTSHSSTPNPDEPRPTGDLADPPPELSATQQAIWRNAIGNAPAGMLKLIDRSVFTIWVVASDALEQARQQVSRLGLMIKVGADPETGKGGVPAQNPYLSIQNKQAAIVMKAAAELGFSPTARPRVKVDKHKPTQNPFANLKSLDD